jgi:hypothetical protein
MDKLLGKQHPPCLRDRDRRRSKVLKKKTPQLPFPEAQPFRQLLHAIPFTVECSLGDKSKGTRNRIRSSTPRSQIRRRLRAAAKTRTEAGILRSRSRAEKSAVLNLRCTRRTYRTTVDSRRGDADINQAIKPGIPALQSPIANLMSGQFHD